MRFKLQVPFYNKSGVNHFKPTSPALYGEIDGIAERMIQQLQQGKPVAEIAAMHGPHEFPISSRRCNDTAIHSNILIPLNAWLFVLRRVQNDPALSDLNHPAAFAPLLEGVTRLFIKGREEFCKNSGTYVQSSYQMCRDDLPQRNGRELFAEMMKGMSDILVFSLRDILDKESLDALTRQRLKNTVATLDTESAATKPAVVTEIPAAPQRTATLYSFASRRVVSSQPRTEPR